jgi:hypothetical protein
MTGFNGERARLWGGKNPSSKPRRSQIGRRRSRNPKILPGARDLSERPFVIVL